MAASVHLIPTVLMEGQTDCLPSYILQAVKNCTVFYVENERTARRYLKLLWKEMPIDDYEWWNMKEITPETESSFRQNIKQGKSIGIISEAGCPGVADPGQKLVEIAQEMKARVVPMVGPNSILLALMASGMNGQRFSFHGYLPIDKMERAKAIVALENESRQKNCTQIFIETPYRNGQMMEALIKGCQKDTRICFAADLTAPSEFIQTKTAAEWKNQLPELHKRPAIFLMYAGLRDG